MKHINRYMRVNKFDDIERSNKAAPVIRKMEGGGWYWINKDILKVYAKSLGSSAIAVYNVLALFSNANTQSCYPTHRTIGRIAGMSKRTVSQKMRQLESSGLIRREWQEGQTICYLLDIKQVIKKTPVGEIIDPGG